MVYKKLYQICAFFVVFQIFLIVLISKLVRNINIENNISIDEQYPNQIEYNFVRNNYSDLSTSVLPNAFIPNKLVANYTHIMLKVLSILTNMLDLHNIPYVLCCGTALGALNHHSILPWDDDMDIDIQSKGIRILRGLFHYNYINKSEYILSSLREDNEQLFRFHIKSLNKYIVNNPHIPKYLNNEDRLSWPFVDIFTNGAKSEYENFIDKNMWKHKKFRYVFLYDPYNRYNISEYDDLIFKVPYNIRLFLESKDMIRWTQCNYFDFLKYKYNRKCKQKYNMNALRQYFNFVKYEWVNSNTEIETLYYLNTDKIIQKVIYKRYVIKNENNQLLCIENATRIKYHFENTDVVQLMQQKDISYYVDCAKQCLFQPSYPLNISHMCTETK
eukprot:318441_1